MMKNNDATKPSKHYYVYTLAYPDGIVFYVGKGTQNRIAKHEHEARQKRVTNGRAVCYCDKCVVIRSIWQRKGTVVRSVVLETSDEALAFEYEKALIVQHSQNILCNKNIKIPKSDMRTLEIKNELLSDDRSASGRRQQGTAAIYQNKTGRWCAAVSQMVPGKGRTRRKFESTTREGAISKLANFLSKPENENWLKNRLAP